MLEETWGFKTFRLVKPSCEGPSVREMPGSRLLRGGRTILKVFRIHMAFTGLEGEAEEARPAGGCEEGRALSDTSRRYEDTL